MRTHFFQHVPFEGLGSIESWLKKAEFETSSTRFYNQTIFPDPDNVDLLIVMGGPMSVNDEKEFPWLIEEKRFIRFYIETGKPVLGICLGAQLIACSMGAKVYPNRVKEIGWFPVKRTQPPSENAFCFPSSLEVFHWHGETFDLPPGAIRLARSAACENQAFQIGASVIGLQFHLESTPESARSLISHCRNELVPSEYVHSEKVILSAPLRKYRAINAQMAGLLSYLVRNE